jgi:hypothetical protein
MLGTDYKDTLIKRAIYESMKRSKYFNGASFQLVENIYPFIKLLDIKQNDIVVQDQEEMNTKLRIIIEGSLINV